MSAASSEDAKPPWEAKRESEAPRKAPPDIKRLLADWRASAEVYAKGHLRMAVRYEKRHYWLGIPSTIMGVVVGTTIFGSLEKAAASWSLKTGLAAVSITSACLVALQTFLRYLERAGQHNVAQAEYSEIAHALELLSMTEKTREDWVKALEGLSHRLDSIKGKAPLPDDIDGLEREAQELAERYRERMHATVKKKAQSPFGAPRYVPPPFGSYDLSEEPPPPAPPPGRPTPPPGLPPLNLPPPPPFFQPPEGFAPMPARRGGPFGLPSMSSGGISGGQPRRPSAELRKGSYVEQLRSFESAFGDD